MRNVWLVLLGVINVTILGLLIALVLESNNDKASIVLIFGYLILVAANLLLWALLALLKSWLTGPMGNFTVFLALLFLPVLVHALNQ
jgi:hypothetical protein